MHRSGTQYHWDLKSGNNEPILSSERYTSKQGAEGGIASCRINSPIDARYTRLTSKANEPYFVLKGANGEIIGTSEMYSSVAARDNGIAACKRDGPTAAIQDNT